MSNTKLLANDDDDDVGELHNSLKGVISNEDDIVIFEIKKKLSKDCIEWLVGRLVTPVADGGVELEVRLLVESEEKLVYHVGAGLKRLIEAAELMRLKKRFVDGTVRDFNVKELLLFAGTEAKETIFSSKEKQQIVLHEMESIRYHKYYTGIPEELSTFYEDQAIFASCKHKHHLNYFPLHNKQHLQQLNKTWVKSFFSKQPLDNIHSYFGDSISFYFAFLGFYTQCLVIPAILGLVFQLLSFFFNNSAVGIFCVFNIIWTSVFLVLWKRKSSELAFRWGTSTYSKYDEPRTEFRGTTRGTNPVTGRQEPLCSSRSKYFRFYTVSLPIIFSLLLFCLFLGCVYFWMFEWVVSTFNKEEPPTASSITWVGTVLSITVTCVYGALIYLIDVTYRKIAVKLNDYENHRLQSTYDNFLIVKLVAFNFVNYFFCLFYVAFYTQDFNRLSKDLATLLITWQVIQQFQEALLPYYAYKYNKNKNLKHLERQIKENLEDDSGIKGVKSGDGGGVGVNSAHQIGKDTSKEEYPGTLDDFLELFLQFGYVFLFSAVFPTAAFWALLNNLTEIRTDGFKLCYIHRRPFATQCQGIGAWLTAFELMGVMAVVTNCALVAMSPTTTEFFSSFGWNSFSTLVFFVIVEHLLLFTKAAITFLVPPTPDWIKTSMAKIEYDTNVAWRQTRTKVLRADAGNLIDKKLQ